MAVRAALRVRKRVPGWTLSTAAGLPRSAAQGRRQWGRPFFGDFLWRSKESYLRRRATSRLPPLAKRMQPKRLATNQNYQFNSCQRLPISARAQFNLKPHRPLRHMVPQQPPRLPCRLGIRVARFQCRQHTQRHVCAVHAPQQHTGHQLISGGHSVVALEAAVKALQQGQGVFRVARVPRGLGQGQGGGGVPAQTARLWRGRSGRP